MAQRLSFQQIQILRKLNTASCSASGFGRLYTGCNLYRSLNILLNKHLIMKNGGNYTITKDGKIVLILFS